MLLYYKCNKNVIFVNIKYSPTFIDFHISLVFLLLFLCMQTLPSSLSSLPSVATNLSPSYLSGSLAEKLIEGLKSPETSLLHPDLLTLADPFNSSAEGSTNGTSSVLVPCLALCLNSPSALHVSSLPSYSFFTHMFTKSRRGKK